MSKISEYYRELREQDVLCQDEYDYEPDEPVPALDDIPDYESKARPDREYLYVGVRFPVSTKVYHYICDDWHVCVGDIVLVPTQGGEEKTAVVTRKKMYSAVSAPYPVYKTKKIIRVLKQEQSDMSATTSMTLSDPAEVRDNSQAEKSDPASPQLNRNNHSGKNALLAIGLIVCLIGFGYFYWKANQLSIINAELESTIDNLEQENQDLNEFGLRAIQSLENSLVVSNFYNDHAAIVSNDGLNLYHKYGCADLDLSYFWIYNIEAIPSQLSPCEKCWK